MLAIQTNEASRSSYAEKGYSPDKFQKRKRLTKCSILHVAQESGMNVAITETGI
jgi:hypothetical protein